MSDEAAQSTTAATVIGGDAAPEAGKAAAPAADVVKPAEGDKTKAAETIAAVDWAKWSPKAVEGVARDERAVGQLRELAKSHNLSGEQAQAVVDLHDGMQRAQAEADSARAEEVQKGWRESLQNDKEFGGAKLKETHADIGRVINAYSQAFPEGAKSLRKVMNETGIGDHHELAKFFAWAGRHMRDDAAGAGSPATPRQTLLDQLYPTSKPA